jgi:hypothetical protein
MAGSDRIAIVSLCLSVATGGFTFFQWWNSQREAHIAAAIDISRKLIDQPLSREETAAVITAYRNDTVPFEQVEKITKNAQLLNYVALLANRNKLEKEYLADDIPCFMVVYNEAMDNLETQFPYLKSHRYLEMKKFVQTTACSAQLGLDQLKKKPGE